MKDSKHFSYYDGPVKDSGMSSEELEAYLQKEKERCSKMKSWDEVNED